MFILEKANKKTAFLKVPLEKIASAEIAQVLSILKPAWKWKYAIRNADLDKDNRRQLNDIWKNSKYNSKVQI